jgi:hypothetical protein
MVAGVDALHRAGEELVVVDGGLATTFEALGVGDVIELGDLLAFVGGTGQVFGGIFDNTVGERR